VCANSIVILLLFVRSKKRSRIWIFLEDEEEVLEAIGIYLDGAL
jgi:hypothetical protein